MAFEKWLSGAAQMKDEAAKLKRIEDVEANRNAKKKEKQRKEIQNMIFQQKRAVDIEAPVAPQGCCPRPEPFNF